MSDGAQIRAHFERELDRIQERLAWTQAEVEAHDKTMQAEIPARVAARRAKLLAYRNILASIGYNLSAGGGDCPIRFRCVGCGHFSTDISYLPDLERYLADLLRHRERLAAIDSRSSV